MLPLKALSALLLAVPVVTAVRGFNYGSTFTDGRPKTLADYQAEFTAANTLEGSDGAFTSARLYTTIQAGSTNDPISAIPAAIATRTSLLLGLWASAGDASFAHELEALRKTIEQYPQLAGLIDGISVGSEDLYRLSPMGVAAGQYAGAEPSTLVKYITQVRALIKDTPFAHAPIGHVDTWTAWGNKTNGVVVENCDWIGMDAYPYFDDFAPNHISDAPDRFADGLGKTLAAAGKDTQVWITETGWPVSGKKVGKAVASPENAKLYWDSVGCSLFKNNTHVWWYTFQDSAPTTPVPSFGIIGSSLTNKPLWDLSCPEEPKASSAPVAIAKTASPYSQVSVAAKASPAPAPASAPAGGAIYGDAGSGHNATRTPPVLASPSLIGTGSGRNATATATPGVVTAGSVKTSFTFITILGMMAVALF
ncbi:putative glucan endo-1,3-beta-glucosidase eglC [Colletotrichum spinosum]|uniref:glucan endo-1,3-beta-D-glucosidase n=1 Tax=Colletotrichum spinosum TaxID=1347390 RepID=A0A4V3HSK5_9PEZI|nr:putative glucan endo-1,3-beta-glucosidase eglC [Colletotrichum spinosum]